MKKTLKSIEFTFNLKEILLREEITVSKLSILTGIEKSRLYDMKNKLNNFPRLDTLLIICNSLNIQLTDLIKLK